MLLLRGRPLGLFARLLSSSSSVRYEDEDEGLALLPCDSKFNVELREIKPRLELSLSSDDICRK